MAIERPDVRGAHSAAAPTLDGPPPVSSPRCAQYQVGDTVTLWVNKVGPYNNPQETCECRLTARLGAATRVQRSAHGEQP